MRDLNKIIIHCSDSRYGSAVDIDRGHRRRGWICIGYHFVIRYSEIDIFDGGIELGRSIKSRGAHVKCHNADSIGICLIGKPSPDTGKCNFSQSQLLSARKLCLYLMEKHNISVDNIFGHYELDSNKTCPAMDMDLFRACMGSNSIDEFSELLDSMV